MTRALLAVWVVGLCLVVAGPAAAQVPEKSVRVSVDTNFVRFNVGGWNPAGKDDWLVRRIEAGMGNPNAAVGLGITLAEALAVGIRLSVGYETEEIFFDEEDSGRATPKDFDSQKFTHLRWGIMPYLDYAFGQKTIRPFIMVALGFEGNKYENFSTVRTIWDFIFGLGGGLHLFASPAVSVDATILLGFSAGAGSTEFPDVLDEEGNPMKSRFTRIMFRANGLLGISGWF